MKSFKPLLATALLAAFSFGTLALADDATGEQTYSGELKCGKCALHQSDHCQNVLSTKDNSGKEVTYWLAENKTSEDFHDNVCKKTEKVTVTGKLSEKDGKQVLTASKIEAAKES